MSASASPMSTSRGAGILLGAATVLVIVAMAHHPVVATRDQTAVLAAIDHLRRPDQLVHGAIMGLLLAFMVGFGGFVAAQERDRGTAGAGLLLYGIGCVAGMFAGLIDGFMLPDIARHFLAAPAGEQATAFDLIVFAGICVQNLSKLALILMSAGIVVWAAMLLTRPGAMRLIGVVGLCAGGGPGLLLIGTFTILRPAGLVAILLGQAIWNLAIAWSLWQRRRDLR